MRIGPPAGAGRWSLVAPLRAAPGTANEPSPTERVHAVALQLLERHGVLTREGVRAEGVPGGFAAVYPVLRALEEGGRIRRGYFVAGLGAAQFALPGAVDRLRALRDEPRAPEPLDPDTFEADPFDPFAPDDEHRPAAETVVLAATDPAQPYGAALAWPDVVEGATRPTRSAGAFVVLRAGAPIAHLDRSGRSVTTMGAGSTEPATWVDALARLVKDGRLRQLEIQRVDGTAVRESPAADPLRQAGFRDGYRGLVLRA